MPERKLNKQFVAVVVRVIDGDTFEARRPNGRKQLIRLAHIDAPESSQPYASAAKVNLERLCKGQAILCHAFKEDLYGRWIARVFLAGVDISRQQLAGGYAWHFVKFAHSEQSSAEFADFAALQEANRSAGRGLFGLPSPIHPDDWRAGLRPTSAPPVAAP